MCLRSLMPAIFPLLVAAAFAAPDVNNGGMDGAPLDHSIDKGFLVTPPGWTPVNVNTACGDRLSVEQSDRPGARQCLHIKTFGSDDGPHQRRPDRGDAREARTDAGRRLQLLPAYRDARR